MTVCILYLAFAYKNTFNQLYFQSELNNLRAWLTSAEEEFKRKESLLGYLSGLDKNSDAFRVRFYIFSFIVSFKYKSILCDCCIINNMY